MTRIRVGAASWTDHEPFYPREYNRADMRSRRIEYYARFFDMVEIDSTFYRLQPTRNFAMWAERTPDDFIFNVKAFGELTWHHRDENGQPQTPHADTFVRFSEMIQPLRDVNKLGAILFQFPPWFIHSEEALEYLATVRESLPEDTIAVEFRHRSWLTPDHVDQTRVALTDARLAYCVPDEPQVGSGSIPSTVLITDPHFALVRFHGRNRATWYGKGLSSSRDRYDYLYSVDELIPWAQRIKDMAAHLTGSEVHVVANNNAVNYGIVNALDLQELLGLPVCKGQELPAGVLQTIRERSGETSAEPAHDAHIPTLWDTTDGE